MTVSYLAILRSQGFDRSSVYPGRRQWHVVCSQCAALTINGIPCHESGCPNQTFECKGCSAQVSRRGAYCEECRS